MRDRVPTRVACDLAQSPFWELTTELFLPFPHPVEPIDQGVKQDSKGSWASE